MRWYDPRHGNIHLDNNALEPPAEEDKLLVTRFKQMEADYGLSAIKPHGVERELSHPNTPDATRENMDGIYTIPTSEGPLETRQKDALRSLLTGNASSEKHYADAEHIFDASKYGGRYFITHDKRILRQKDQIAEIVGSELQIVTLREFIEACEAHGLE